MNQPKFRGEDVALGNFLPAGGTELLVDSLYQKTKIKDYEDINLLVSIPQPNTIRYAKHNLLWQHHSYSQPGVASLYNTPLEKSIDSWVYVSNWQYEKYRYFHKISTRNSNIIKNAIDPIEFVKKPSGEKLKLIYASTPFRGLDVLLESFELLDREDVELDVYSSTIIYGSDYYNENNKKFESLFERAREMKNVNYLGYAENHKIRNAMQQAHILAYPSTFEETSCLVMIEAGAAGCDMVTTNLGALYETGSEYAKMIPAGTSRDILIANYASALADAVDGYWGIENQEKLKKQSDFYNQNYSWEKRSKEWNMLFDKISHA